MTPAVPKWMVPFTIGEGAWLYASKPALKAGMTPRFDLKTNVWCCGILGSHGYRGELAVTMFRGKEAPLTPALMALQIQQVAVAYYCEAGLELSEDEKKALRPKRQEMRRVIVALEEEGVAERQVREDVNIKEHFIRAGTLVRNLPPEISKRLHSAKVGLYFFVIPRTPRTRPNKPREVVKNAYFSFANCSAQESAQVFRIFENYKGTLPNFNELRGRLKDAGRNGYIGSAAEEAIRAYFEAESVVAKALADRLEVALTERRFEIPSENETLKTTTPVVIGEQPVVVAPEAEGKFVLDELRRYGWTTLNAATDLLAKCREKFPGATPADVIAVCQEISKTFSKNVLNPIGILLAKVPEYFAAYEPAPEMVHFGGLRPMLKQDAVTYLRMMLADGSADEDTRQWAACELGKLLGTARASRT